MYYRGLRLGLLLLTLPGVVFTQVWVSRYAGPAADRAVSVVVDADGNTYVTGYSTGAATARDFLTIKYKPTGDTVWTRRYTTGGALDDEAVGIAMDPAGFVLVTGAVAGATSDIVTIKYNALTGDTAWTRRVNGPANGADRPAAVAVDGSGSIYVGGSVGVGTHSEAAIVKYSPAGTQQWLTRVGTTLGDSSTSLRALCTDRAGYVYACGRMRDSLGMDDYLTTKLSPTGSVAWTRRYNGAGRGADSAQAVGVDAAGNVFVTGSSRGDTTGIDMVTLKYSSAGTLLWAVRGDGRRAIEDGGVALAVDAAGNVWTTGYVVGASSTDIAVVRYGPGGNVLCRATYDGASHRVDVPAAVAVDADGAACLTGASQSTTGYDLLTARYDTLGILRWAARYDGASHADDRGLALAVPTAGTALVTGFCRGTSATDDYVTIKYLERDEAITRFVNPTGAVPPLPLVPRVRLHNYGMLRDTVTVSLAISREGVPVYLDTVTAAGIAPNSDRDVAFAVFVGAPGEYVIRAEVAVAGDLNPANDTLSLPFTFDWQVRPTWTLRRDVPPGLSGKKVKDGGALCYGQFGPAGPMLFALKGYNTSEFYGFATGADSWLVLESLPMGESRKKRVKKGAALAFDRYDTAVYALKGNNTTEFWKYDVIQDSWCRLKDIPLGVSNKKVKGGSGLACLRRSTGDFVYALKGGKRNEFWAFDVARDTWLAMADVPPGERLKGMGDGSGLVAAGTRLFALKAAVNEFYAYDPVANAWLDAALLPLAGVSKGNKTARYGSALAADGNFVYAIKGGSNEFWTHAIDANVWFELETLPGMPSGKTVRNGGAIAAGGGRVWALKGNKTAEFWCYDPGSALQAGSAGPARGTQAARPATARYVDFRLYPNPVAGEHVWMWSARPVARPAVLRVLDVAGRVVVARGLGPGGSSKLQVDLGAVSAGVYVVELSGSGPTVTQKLVVER